jgi:zinc protease
LTDPGFRADGEWEAQKIVRQIYVDLEHTAEGMFEKEGECFLHCGDKRFGYPERQVLEGYRMDDLKRWLEPHLREGYVEISVVGDANIDDVISHVAATFGAIDVRTGKPTATDINMPLPVGQSANFSYKSEIPKGLVHVFWPTDDRWNREQKFRLDLLADVISDRLRLRIRKEMGDTYSPHARHFASSTFANYGYICATAVVDVDRVNDVTYMLHEVVKDIRRNGIDEDEFIRVLQPTLSKANEQLRRNGYWLGSIDGSQAYPKKLEFPRTMLQLCESVRREDLRSVLKFLDEKRRMTIKIRPQLQ